MPLSDRTLPELQHLLQIKQISSVELTQESLTAIAKHDPMLHSFLFVDEKNALQKAKNADDLRATMSSGISPLLGIPLAVKDIIAVEGMPCTAGSKILEGYYPPYSATAVKKLEQAGMIVLGKTNTDEFAMGSTTENSAYGVTHNPWKYDHVPGGSSGGSAAAVAARLARAALGTDTGGSVRQPAAFCGISGLKPTYGRVSRNGLVAYGSSLDVCGVFGAGVEDLWPVYQAMAGKDPLDATTADKPVLAPDEKANNLKGIRIGIPKEYFIAGIQPEVESEIRKAIEVLASLGAEIVDVSLPHTEYAVPVYYILAPAEASANLARFDGVRYGPRVEGNNMWDVFLKTRGEKFGDEVTRRIMLGTYALSSGYYDAYYGQAQKVRKLIKKDFVDAFKQVDAVLGPVAPTTALKIGAHSGDPLSMYLEDIYTLTANLAGVPGLALPAGFDKAGLPVGMQLLGNFFEENTLYRIGKVYQQNTSWHKQKPVLL
jgi:aspartyl-tRNA(Asn)/glutamyl-tRNA(Gln) amidotransferase subunit A